MAKYLTTWPLRVEHSLSAISCVLQKVCTTGSIAAPFVTLSVSFLEGLPLLLFTSTFVSKSIGDVAPPAEADCAFKCFTT